MENDKDNYKDRFIMACKMVDDCKEDYLALKELHNECIKNKVKEHYHNAFEDRITIRLAILDDKFDKLLELFYKK